MNTLLLLLLALLLLLLAGLVRLTYKFAALQKDQHHAMEVGGDRAGQEVLLEKLSYAKGFLYAGIVLVAILMAAVFYLLIEGTVYEGHFREWLNIAVRWMHITFGIAWIGTSFYFVFLENALNRTKNVREELAGNLWAVHGGGFYYLEKYKLAPRAIPEELHWFKYEAYFTWLSGFNLLFVVYYFNAKAFLIDPGVMALTPAATIGIGVASLAAGWLAYDWLCKTRLIYRPLPFALTGFLLCCGFAWFYSQVFSGRAAYIHFGAMLGTLMAGNVFFVIIPSQKAMVRAAKKRLPLDPALGKFAGLRSLHNNYLTLPVLFVMISNHFPSTFGHQHQWAVLMAISLGSAGIKHYLNLREKGQQSVWVMPASVVLLLSVAFYTAPVPKGGQCTEEVAFSQVYPIIQARCQSCHSSRPTDEDWAAPPNGVAYDTPDDIARLADKILLRAVLTETMPPNNKTGITPEEREVLRCWIEQGGEVR
ncbi:MAG: urate hydroxylase PuuD [Phaeodactylibacter sp.]|nr:urate hydroxylase PuuD [Phaeodactylibacter sp.]